MSDYGKRECLACGEMFQPAYASQVCCSKDCARKRKLEQGRKHNRECAAKRREKLKGYDAMLFAMGELELEVERLKSELAHEQEGRDAVTRDLRMERDQARKEADAWRGEVDRLKAEMAKADAEALPKGSAVPANIKKENVRLKQQVRELEERLTLAGVVL